MSNIKTTNIKLFNVKDSGGYFDAELFGKQSER